MSENKPSGGIGFTGLLTVAFIVLKLCGVITWSWWWVLCPAWAGIALIALGGILYLISLGLKKIGEENSQKNDRVKYPSESKWQVRLREMQEANKKRHA